MECGIKKLWNRGQSNRRRSYPNCGQYVHITSFKALFSAAKYAQADNNFCYIEKHDLTWDIFYLDFRPTTIEEGHYSDQSYSYLMSPFRNGVLKFKNGSILNISYVLVIIPNPSNGTPLSLGISKQSHANPRKLSIKYNTKLYLEALQGSTRPLLSWTKADHDHGKL